MNDPARFKGVAALYASALIFTFVSISVKFAAASYSGLFVSAIRFVIGVILCLAVILPTRRGEGGIAGWRGTRGLGARGLGTRGLGAARLSDWVLRGLFGAFSMVATYASISLTGPGRATLLTNTYPVFVALFGALFFGERLRVRSLLSLALATAGAILVVRDGSGSSLAGDALALTGSVLAGVAVNFVRRASKAGCDPFFLYLSPCLFGLPLLFFAPLPGASGGPVGLFFLLAVGAGAFLAQALMATGYRTVPAGRGSVVFYAETGLTVLLGALLAGERFTVRFGAGLLLIAVGLWLNRESPGRPSLPGGLTRQKGTLS